MREMMMGRGSSRGEPASTPDERMEVKVAFSSDELLPFFGCAISR
jgi:hypothetical protein